MAIGQRQKLERRRVYYGELNRPLTPSQAYSKMGNFVPGNKEKNGQEFLVPPKVISWA
jgi:hypothetical protein